METELAQQLERQIKENEKLRDAACRKAEPEHVKEVVLFVAEETLLDIAMHWMIGTGTALNLFASTVLRTSITVPDHLQQEKDQQCDQLTKNLERLKRDKEIEREISVVYLPEVRKKLFEAKKKADTSRKEITGFQMQIQSLQNQLEPNKMHAFSNPVSESSARSMQVRSINAVKANLTKMKH